VVVMVLEKVPQAMRGELTRWLIEVKTGVYIGHVTAMVRDRLWEKCTKDRKSGVVFQAWSTNNEQHYNMRITQNSEREIVNWEGILLVRELEEKLSPVQKKRVSRRNTQSSLPAR